MNAELKQRWIAALRSGRYEQGCARLRAGGKYCCIGVLADILGPNDWEVSEGEAGYLWDGQGTEMDDVSLGAIGLSAADQSDLIGLNDEECLPFPAIADWIEQNVEVTS